ncbi:putative secreted protein [Trichoplax sp. H2]|uniref:Peptidase M15C domain-containing protein n=1 Tax=Trichoplax adhaerens TaxID=10228 RepID=B3SC14_TRIAD|nr:expressed hypothetical protein [Trichoplax adhaerens]EDV19771.1 expressed hypothetical protein [Trichoplax adhaerens]RDD41161.1 putative secreted protein [Trichoplax sp. H2]|eukprot:XP_002117795.1 expressed hypothetical protein [Trichoplax adhaerens]
MKIFTIFAVIFACAHGLGEDCNGSWGSCQDYQNCHTGSTITGQCAGPWNIQCCPKVGQSCKSNTGNCMLTSHCSGTTYAGYCPGPSNVKCCTGGSSGGCPLTKYTGSKIIGSTCTVEVGFVPQMDKINSWASSCNVQVYITSSYRANADVSGAIVQPASRSNHMIGHAIDMNVVDGATGVFCNSNCLRSLSTAPSGVKCFINKVQADSVLRWGMSFNDPVHIDEPININYPSRWDQLYWATQGACVSK